MSGFIQALASVVGVPLGTVIADHWRWQDAFTMCVVITAVATIIALLVLPKNLNAGEGNYSDRIQIFKDKTIWYGIGFVICAAATLYGYYTYIRPLVHVQLKFDLNALSLIWLLLGVVAIFGSTTQVLFLNEASKKYPAAIKLASTLSAIFYNVGIFNDSRTSFEIRWFN